MLGRLYLKNIAVIKEETIELSEGFNVFTGETGAGKTILINAISGILGARLSKDIIRNGEEQAVITASFTDLDEKKIAAIEEMGYETSDESVIINRTINAQGKSTCKINGRPANLQILKEITDGLIDIHGQRDSGFLMNKDNHITFLDKFGDFDDLLQSYKTIFREVAAIKKELSELEMDEQAKSRRLDVLNFQINEITSADLEDGELDGLVAQRDIFRNAEKISECLGVCKEVFEPDEQAGILDLITSLSDAVSTAGAYIDDIKQLVPRIESAYYELKDISEEISSVAGEVEFNAVELARVEDRISTIRMLEKKYGEGYDSINKFLENCVSEKERIEFSDTKAQDLSDRAQALLPKLKKLAGEITSARLRAANELLQKVQKELTFLNMPSVKLSLKHDYTKLRSSGQDSIEFLIATNEGEEAKPLSKIASGGELSRIMLSIKNVFARIDDVATSVFDEVDAGVSGEAAQKIGEKLSQVSSGRQIICVTHLAQVAMFADSHFVIEKNVHDGRTYTNVTKLSRDERIKEIARITSGNVINDIALKNAQSLLDYADNK